MKERACLVAVPTVILCIFQTYSHDYWLAAEPYFLRAGGGTALIRLHVGEGLVSEEERLLQKERTTAPT